MQIFYDPQNPEIIASPRSVVVGHFWLIFALFFLGLVLFTLWLMIRWRREYLVTQAEYDKEAEQQKRIRAERKRSQLEEQKKRQQLKAERKSRHPKARKIGKIILIILGVLVGAFILFLLFGLFLMSIGYGAD